MENKKRLIDANAHIAKVCKSCGRGCELDNECCILVDDLMAAPTVDAVEVVHGQWKKDWCDNNMIGHEFEECSKCGCSMLDTNQFWDSNYCPNCGAKMDGERNDMQ